MRIVLDDSRLTFLRIPQNVQLEYRLLYDKTLRPRDDENLIVHELRFFETRQPDLMFKAKIISMDATNLEEIGVNPGLRVEHILVDPSMKESVKDVCLQTFGIP